ncbi:MAG: hypothetical protein Q9227_001872 [Pyrenula ochraceoflavens]
MDVLSDDNLDNLQKALPLFAELGVNTIRVYHIDSSALHDSAMDLLQKAGIYVLADLSTPRNCINRLSPYQSYTDGLMRNFFKTVNCLARYENVIGVVVANNLVNNVQCSPAAEVVRAAVRDLKYYMARKNQLSGQRVLPIGTSHAPFGDSTESMLQYFTAGSLKERVDFFSIHDYAPEVPDESHHRPAFGQHVSILSTVPLPMLVLEYGNNAIRPRLFNETTPLYSPDFLQTLSGGCCYEFFEASNAYGIVRVNEEDMSLIKTAEFDNLKDKLHETTTDLSTNQQGSFPTQEELGWRGDFPAVSERWMAKPDIPESRVDWKSEDLWR